MNILFATNSVLYSMNGGEWNVESQFLELARAGGQSVTQTVSRLGGGTLQDHWDDDFRVNAREELETGNYDLFFANGRTATEDGFDTNAARFENLATANNTPMYLLSTWPGDWEISLTDPNSVANAEDAAHRAAANANGTGYIPMILAYRDFYLDLASRYNDTQDGELVEDLLTADTIHGTHLLNYLAASMLYASAFDAAPPSSWVPPGVTNADAALARSIAWSVTQQYGIAPDGNSGGGGGNPNTDPVLSLAAEVTVDENEVDVATATATDADGDGLTFSIISGGADAALFSIDGNSGVLQFQNPPDYEAPADAGGNNVYNVTVSVSDGQGGSDSQAVAVTVSDVEEEGGGAGTGGPDYSGYTPLIAAGYTQGTSGQDVFDFNETRGDVANGGGGGLDAYRFNAFSNDRTHRVRDLETGELIDVSGVINFTTGPVEAYVRFDNTFLQVDVDGAQGGANFVDLAKLLGVSGLDARSLYDAGLLYIGDGGGGDNTAPVLTSPTAFSLAENGTAIGTISATDADGDGLTFSISGGADAALFSIDGNSGVLQFQNPPDYEALADTGGNNVYDLTVAVSDGTDTTTAELTVAVTDVSEGGGGPDYAGYTPIAVAGYTRGTSGQDLFQLGTTRGDVAANAGSDAFQFTEFSDGRSHRLRAYETDEILDVSAVANYTSGAISDYVRIVDSGSAASLQVDATGAADGADFTELARILNAAGLDEQLLYDAGLLIL